MSQDQPKQPQPEKQTSPTPAPKPGTTQSESGLQQVIQTLQETWTRVQPVLQAQSVKALRGTSRLLKGVADKLDAESTQQPPLPVDTLPSAATLPPETSAPAEPNVVTVTPEVVTPNAKSGQPASQMQSLWERSRPIIATLLVWWKAILEKIRARLPESVKPKLQSDTALTGAIAALFILFFWTISALTPGKPVVVAKVPPTIPTAVPEVQVTPDITASPEVQVTPEIKALPEVQVPPAIKAPPELKAPKPPKPVKNEPPPAPILTPEQNLIASIQKQVAEITGDYADGLIQSIQANFQDSLLTVRVTEDWYNFDAAKQDRLAADMWNRSKELDFNKLKVTDPEGKLLARSPVVGSNMVIVQRGRLEAS